MLAGRKPGSVLVGHLSSPDVTTRLKRVIDGYGGRPCTVSLQQAGFTSPKLRHRRGLWAFTPLFSPVPGSFEANPVVSFLWHFP